MLNNKVINQFAILFVLIMEYVLMTMYVTALKLIIQELFVQKDTNKKDIKG